MSWIFALFEFSNFWNYFSRSYTSIYFYKLSLIYFLRCEWAMTPQPNDAGDTVNGTVTFSMNDYVKCQACCDKYGSIYWLKPHDCVLVERYALARKTYKTGQMGANKTTDPLIWVRQKLSITYTGDFKDLMGVFYKDERSFVYRLKIRFQKSVKGFCWRMCGL